VLDTMNRVGAFRVFVVIASVAWVGCSGGAKHLAADGGADQMDDHLVDQEGPTADAADAPVALPSNLMPPAQPMISCGGDAAACSLPPSACAVPAGCGASSCGSSPWVVYYDNPRCVDGACAWDQRYFQCETNICFNGGCLPLSTTVP
jgi:hypothetical protein